jgi:hypothetical protein
MNKKYSKYTDDEWEDIKQYYLSDDSITHNDVKEKYNISHTDCNRRLKGLKPHKVRLDINIGDKFNKLTIIEHLPNHVKPSGQAARMVRCECECGTVKDILLHSVLSNGTKSCGCHLNKSLGDSWDAATRRGDLAGRRTKTSYFSMVRRCTDPNHDNYHRYGGRGITICDRWMEPNSLGYQNFKEDMGERPEGMTLDRIDPNGNYEPCNCQWATPRQQSLNQVQNSHFTRYSDDEWEDIKNDYTTNRLSYNMIREKYNVSISDCNRFLKGLKPKNRLNLYDKDVWLKIVEEFDGGVHYKMLCEKYKISSGTLYKNMKLIKEDESV